MQFDSAALAGMHPVGSVTDDGSGHAAIDFPETTGRYIMLRWTPSQQQEAPFAVAEVAAFGDGKAANLVAANTTTSSQARLASDGKTMLDGKDFNDMGAGKDMPEEGPAEGPGPQLPEPPPFVFVPVVNPASP